LTLGAGARLWFLPPYSPDLNPIERAFAKIKHWMRDAQKRTIEDTWRHVGVLVETITPTECANYIANSGYASIKT
jgi:putative transposase